MRKTLYLHILSSILFLFMISLVMAVLFEHNIAVKIKTNPNQDLVVRFEDFQTEEMFKSVPTKTDSVGNARINLATNREEVNVLIFFIEDPDKFLQEDNIIRNETTGPYSTDSAIEINVDEIVAERVRAELNETNVSEESENQTIEEVIEEIEGEESEKETGSKITGSAIFGDEGFLSKKTIYYILGIVVLLIGFLIIKTMRKKLRSPREIKIKKLSEMQDEKKMQIEKKEELKDKKEIIADAEKKIKEAQEDIRKIKNEDKIKEAERKVIESEKELNRLREGKE